MWLIADYVYQEMQARSKGFAANSEAQARFAAAMIGDSASMPRNMQVAGDVARISVEGILTPKPDFFAWLLGMGNTSYDSIQKAIAAAEADPGVKAIEFFIDSPGGTSAGLFETLGAIQASNKPKTVVTPLAASAAYAIAAVSGKITATTAASQIGSIGTVRAFYVDEHIVQITNSNSPKKRPDIKTEEGKAMVREELDALNELFVEAIADGRGVTVEKVNASFGQGGVFVARDAKKLGMIDAIRSPGLRVVPGTSDEEEAITDATAAGNVAGETVTEFSVTNETKAAPAGGAAKQKKGRKMDLSTLKSEQPDLCAALREEGRKEGHAQGAEKERDRVSAHLIRGQANGAMELALESVESGVEMTETLKAKYDTAGKNQRAVEARQEENAAVEAATAGASEPNAGGKDLQDVVADNIAAGLGL